MPGVLKAAPRRGAAGPGASARAQPWEARPGTRRATWAERRRLTRLIRHADPMQRAAAFPVARGQIPIA